MCVWDGVEGRGVAVWVLWLVQSADTAPAATWSACAGCSVSVFDSQGRERLGAPAERLAAAASRPAGDVTPLGAAARPRDVAFERAWTTQAAESVRVRADELIAFAELRAGHGPVRDLLTRDMGREVREELADARNYLVWWALQASCQREPDGELTALIAGALQPVIVAFDWASRARLRQAGV